MSNRRHGKYSRRKRHQGRKIAIILALATIGTAGAFTDDSNASPVVKIQTATVAHAEPRESSKTVANVSPTTTISHAPTRLAVTQRVYDATGQSWYRVMLPGRNNRRGGWVSGASVSVESATYSVKVDLSARKATLYKGSKRQASYKVVIGASKTPTPTGRFQVLEVVRQPHNAKIGPYVLATNAYSRVLKQFGGGPGQIGLHGRTGLSDPLGSARSHGCVRFADATITALAQKLTAGSLVHISR